MLGMGTDDYGGMGDSFQKFLRRPENQPIIEAMQRKQIRKSMKAQNIQGARDFQSKVLGADQNAVSDIAPYMKSPALRAVIRSFTNDEDGNFGRWASNPHVLEMLKKAKWMLDEGHITEEEMMRGFQDQIENGRADAQDAQAEDQPRAGLPRVMRLATDELVPALNEHLTERQRGNELYRRGQIDEALHHYERAKGIVDIIQGMGKADQKEIDTIKVSVLLNIAAVLMERGEFAAACKSCTDALVLDPKNVRGLVRRAQCLIARHQHKEARADLDAADELDPYNMKAAEVRRKLSMVSARGKGNEAAVCAKMFDKGT